MSEVIVRYDDNGYGNIQGEIVGEVVRCKDCWKRPFDNCPFYEHLGYQPEDDFFCGEGERKDNE